MPSPFVRATTRLVALAIALLGHAAMAQSPAPFDGNWDVVLNCPAHNGEDDDAKGYRHRFPGKVEAGELSATYGTPGEPGWQHLHGAIGNEGKADLRLDGIVGRPDYAVNNATRGKPFSYRVRASFTSTQGSGQRVGRRKCDFSFSKN